MAPSWQGSLEAGIDAKTYALMSINADALG